MRFWDASAIVPLLLPESSSARMTASYRDDDSVVVWWGTEVECTSGIVRRLREGLPPAIADRALATLALFGTEWRTIAPSVTLRDDAIRLLKAHPLRAADALQLAAAMAPAPNSPNRLPFVTLDRRLADAAQREGFTVIGF